MFWRFIKELWHNIRSTYDGFGLWIGAIITISWWLLPTFNLGNKVNAVIATMSLAYRLLIMQSCLLVSVILAAYRMYKKQQKPFFEDNVKVVINGLESNIKEINNWLEYIKKHQQFAFKELVQRVFAITTPTFVPTNRKSVLCRKPLNSTYFKLAPNSRLLYTIENEHNN
jgi:hypothetical protein